MGQKKSGVIDLAVRLLAAKAGFKD